MKKLKITVCLILFAMLIGVLPVGTFAALQTNAVNAVPASDGKDGDPVKITEIRIDGYQKAVIGKKSADMPAVTVPEDAPYTIVGIYWWNDTKGEWLSSSNTFEAGNHYSCQYYVKPNSGYAFADNPAIYINGGTELVDLSYCQQLSDGKYEAWSISEEAVAGSFETETVEVIDILNFVKPAPGTKCSEAAMPTVADDAPYYIGEYYWYCDSDSAGLSSDGVFDAEKSYSLYMKFNAKENGEFSSDDTYAQINGTRDLVDSRYGGYLSKSLFAVWTVTFRPGEDAAEEITEIRINGYQTAVIGKTPDEMPAVTVPDDAPYTIYGIYWWNDTANSWLSGSDVFETGNYYSCQFYIEPNDGYLFTAHPTIYINGGTELVDLAFGGLMSSGKYEVWSVSEEAVSGGPSAITEIRINGYQKAVIGKKSADMPAVTVPEDAPYTIVGTYWWNDTKGIWMGSSDKFEAGNHYSCQYYVKPNDGYAFADNPTIYINGSTELADLSYCKQLSDGKYEAWSISEEAVSGGSGVLYGDCNGDGKIDGKDLIRLRKYLDNYNSLTGQSTVDINKSNADCNGDSDINGKDLIRLRKYLDNYNSSTGTSTITLGP